MFYTDDINTCQSFTDKSNTILSFLTNLYQRWLKAYHSFFSTISCFQQTCAGTFLCQVVPLYSCGTAAVTSADTRCPHKTTVYLQQELPSVDFSPSQQSLITTIHFTFSTHHHTTSRHQLLFPNTTRGPDLLASGSVEMIQMAGAFMKSLSSTLFSSARANASSSGDVSGHQSTMNLSLASQ